MSMNDVVEKKILFKRVDSYGPKPRSGVEVLRQTRAFLEEEGRWCQGALFEDGDPKKVFENGSLCGNWGVCLMGGIGAVTGTLSVSVVREEYAEDDYEYEWLISSEADVLKDPAAAKAVRKLADIIRADGFIDTNDDIRAVTETNDEDDTDRDAVLKLLDRAIGDKG